MSTQCFLLTSDQLNNYLAQGYVLKGGPFTFEADCLANCIAITTDCSCCPSGAPLTWTVTFAGITNGSCSTCTVLNGTFNLIYGNNGAGNCAWRSNAFSCCGNTSSYVELICNGITWSLQIVFGGNVAWTTPVISWNCLGSNNLSGGSPSPPGVCGFPSTVTVSPA